MFVLSLAIVILHVVSARQQNVPSVSTLHYIHKKYPTMKLQHCIEVLEQCRLFASCNGIYLHLQTGKCLFNDTEQLTETSTKQANTTTPSSQTAIEAQSISTTATSTEVIPTTQVSTHVASSTINVEETTTTIDIITTTTSTINPTTVAVGNTGNIVEQITKSIYFEKPSLDHEIYTQLFDTSELSTCFWMKLKETNKCGILSIFQVPVASHVNCNDFMLMADSETVFFIKNLNTGSNKRLIASTRFAKLNQYHICFGWNVTKAVFYVNGKLDSWHNTNDDTKLTANRYVIGNDLGGGDFKCLLDSSATSCLGKFYRLNIWNRFLKENEMKSIYEGSLPLSNLMVTWDDILNFTPTNSITKITFPLD